MSLLFQLFGIGFLLTLSGPCLFTCCGPAAILCAATGGGKFRGSLKSALLFLSGRLSATLLYGFFAGLSARELSAFVAHHSSAIRSVTALFFIGAALLLLAGKSLFSRCGSGVKKGGFFLMGSSMGLLPCPPFIAIFLEIAMRSSGPADALLMSFFFGAGLFASALLVIAAAGGALGRLASEMVKRPGLHLAARILSAALFLFIAFAYFLR